MLLDLFVPQYIYFYSCLSMETAPNCWWAELCQLQPIRSSQWCCTDAPSSAEAQQAGLAVPGAAQPLGVAGWTSPHHPAKPREWLCPSCSSDFPRDAQRCWGGRICYWMEWIWFPVAFKSDWSWDSSSFVLLLLVVGCCSCASRKNLKRF